MSFRRMALREFAGYVNGGVEAYRRIVDVAGVQCDVNRDCRITVERGDLVYKDGRRTIGRVLPGDIFYLESGEIVEVL